MAKNYMAEVAKMLGVEFGEEFKVAERGCSYDTLYYLDSRGAWDADGQVADAIIPALMTGFYEIVKIPWKPKYGDNYFYLWLSTKKIYGDCWTGNTYDYAIYNLGMCYRTQEEASEHFAEDYKKLTGKELGK